MNAQQEENDFLVKQLKYERVASALIEKETYLKNEFESKALNWPPSSIYLRSFKAEAVLELWIKEDEEFKLFKKYPICKNSGGFGPKRKQGDGQVPEGLYFIDRFNPISSFHLSLGVNYPNDSDKILADKEKPGGDIFIHGDCVTIGCLPLTDDKIKEVYLIAMFAKAAGQEDIPIHFFPFRFNELNKHIYYKEFPELTSFWENIRPAYTSFERNTVILKYNVDNNGKYVY